MHLPPDRAAWRARTDGTAADLLRWHQVMRLPKSLEALPALSEGQLGLAIIGFACDEGVVRNLGRVGAAEGPQVLRHFCAGLPVHFASERHVLADAGTVVCQHQDMEAAQEELGVWVAGLLAKGYLPLIWGGGHEVTYGHWLGTRTVLKEKEAVACLNFDAHYDLRPVENGLRHSGNSFTAIDADCRAEDRAFAYAALGIQRLSNTRDLFNRAGSIGALTILAEEAGAATLSETHARLADFLAPERPLMVTIDMDVFSASTAPGVSAPNALGLLPGSAFMRLLRQVLYSPNLRSVDIAELNPRYDVDNRTARLGAAISFEVAQGWLGRA